MKLPARALTDPENYADLLAAVGNRRLVLLGEATHGTHEFYDARAEITKQLIVEKGFGAVAVEADWPDAYRVNRYVRLRTGDSNADEALSDFHRFPTWMWRNRDVLQFVEWLRAHNAALHADAPSVGFYGLDFYSLYRSIDVLIATLERLDPEAAKRARERYACFEQFADHEDYAFRAGLQTSKSCEDEAVQQLTDLLVQQVMPDVEVADEDDRFFAEQNARVVRNAERYYRAMFGGEVNTWNLRDQHMAETIDALLVQLAKTQRPSKLVIWEHNSHVGDARATERASVGELNVGQLVRERHPDDSRLVGFTTYSGTVAAADDWDQLPQIKSVRPALADSYESVFHETGLARFMMLFPDQNSPSPSGGGQGGGAMLRAPRLERAIGVVYRPQTERISHYFYARLPDQFDAVIHFDLTTAVEPLIPVPAPPRMRPPSLPSPARGGGKS
jgi:erythromycin esterase-like protein